MLPVRKDLLEEMRYGFTAFGLSMLHRVEGFTLSKPPLMSRNSVESFLPAIWSVLTSWVSVVIASEVDRPASDPHWGGLRRPATRATHQSLEFMILFGISENVCSSTITQKEEGEL